VKPSDVISFFPSSPPQSQIFFWKLLLWPFLSPFPIQSHYASLFSEVTTLPPFLVMKLPFLFFAPLFSLTQDSELMLFSFENFFFGF